MEPFLPQCTRALGAWDIIPYHGHIIGVQRGKGLLGQQIVWYDGENVAQEDFAPFGARMEFSVFEDGERVEYVVKLGPDCHLSVKIDRFSDNLPRCQAPLEDELSHIIWRGIGSSSFFLSRLPSCIKSLSSCAKIFGRCANKCCKMVTL